MLNPHPRSGSSFSRMCIGLLGGSFNPAHEGHLAMSLYALKRLGLDQIWWLVSPQNPLKAAHDMAPFTARLEQARATAHHPKILVTDIEAQFGTRYTADTLRALHRRFPSTRFVWLMGADNFAQIPRWKNWAHIFAQMPVAVFRRPGYDAAIKGKAAMRFAKARHSFRQGKKLALMPPPAWLVLDNRLNLLSATALRRQRSR
jgi:nicotinate-nucleotide adenylyltransferase